jgi:hypothetical protein
MGQGLVWVGMWPRWRRVPSAFRSMWAACRSDGKPWWRRIWPALAMAWMVLQPWPVSLGWGRLTFYGWGWDLRLTTGWLTWSRDHGLYRSPQGTPGHPDAVPWWTPRARQRAAWRAERLAREDDACCATP